MLINFVRIRIWHINFKLILLIYLRKPLKYQFKNDDRLDRNYDILLINTKLKAEGLK